MRQFGSPAELFNKVSDPIIKHEQPKALDKEKSESYHITPKALSPSPFSIKVPARDDPLLNELNQLESELLPNVQHDHNPSLDWDSGSVPLVKAMLGLWSQSFVRMKHDYMSEWQSALTTNQTEQISTPSDRIKTAKYSSKYSDAKSVTSYKSSSTYYSTISGTEGKKSVPLGTLTG